MSTPGLSPDPGNPAKQRDSITPFLLSTFLSSYLKSIDPKSVLVSSTALELLLFVPFFTGNGYQKKTFEKHGVWIGLLGLQTWAIHPDTITIAQSQITSSLRSLFLQCVVLGIDSRITPLLVLGPWGQGEKETHNATSPKDRIVALLFNHTTRQL